MWGIFLILGFFFIRYRIRIRNCFVGGVGLGRYLGCFEVWVLDIENGELWSVG